MRLVDPKPSPMKVGCNRIFNMNTNMARNIHTFKANMVEKVFAQTQELDYEETFSTVAKKRSMWLLPFSLIKCVSKWIFK